MTEREIRNAKMKHQIKQCAESWCDFIDIMELDIKERELMISQLSAELDKYNQEEKSTAA